MSKARYIQEVASLAEKLEAETVSGVGGTSDPTLPYSPPSTPSGRASRGWSTTWCSAGCHCWRSSSRRQRASSWSRARWRRPCACTDNCTSGTRRWLWPGLRQAVLEASFCVLPAYCVSSCVLTALPSAPPRSPLAGGILPQVAARHRSRGAGGRAQGAEWRALLGCFPVHESRTSSEGSQDSHEP